MASRNFTQKQQTMDHSACRHFALIVAAPCTRHRRRENADILESGSEQQINAICSFQGINTGRARPRHGHRIFRAWPESRKSKPMHNTHSGHMRLDQMARYARILAADAKRRDAQRRNRGGS